MDKITNQQRSYIMSRIRGSNTKPELMIKRNTDGRKLRYQPRGIRGSPDFANKRRKIAVFVDGCFWHKCPKCYRPPKSNRKFWNAKIERNTERDKLANLQMRKDGWTVLRFWEHQVTRNPNHVIRKINRVVG